MTGFLGFIHHTHATVVPLLDNSIGRSPVNSKNRKDLKKVFLEPAQEGVYHFSPLYNHTRNYVDGRKKSGNTGASRACAVEFSPSLSATRNHDRATARKTDGQASQPGDGGRGRRGILGCRAAFNVCGA